MAPAYHDLFHAPSLLDPRVIVLVPVAARPTIAAMWRLESKLFDVVVQRRETMLAQIKLAWWRERLLQLANDPAALPRGEPLLAELSQLWPGNKDLAAIVDGYEAAMLAAAATDIVDAAEQLANAMQPLHHLIGPSPKLEIWSLVRAGQMAAERELARHAWAEAAACGATGKGARSLQTLERWAQLVARQDGAASPRSEAWLLFRSGLGF